MKRQRILVIDDEADLRATVELRFSAAGFEVIQASGGEEGLELARRRRPAAIILDVNMPGIDGFETCRRLRAERRTKNIPVIMLTACRRVGELDWGTKAFGTVGPHRFGLLDAYRRGGENHLVWNYEHHFGTEGNVAFSGVDRRVPGDPDNLALGLGSSWKFPFRGGSRSLSAQWFTSNTSGDGGDDHAVEFDVSAWRDQGFGWWAGYSSVGDEFRADDGYVPETGVHDFDVGLSHVRSHDDGAVLSTEFYGGAATGESQLGPRRRVWLDHGTMWRNGWSIWASFSGGTGVGRCARMGVLTSPG